MNEDLPSLNGEMWVDPDMTSVLAHTWFRRRKEWPNVAEFHAHVADFCQCPIEVAAYDVLNALDKGEVYGLPSVVAMRHGEAVGDWRRGAAALGPGDNGFRIAVPQEECDRANLAREAVYAAWSKS